MAFFAGKLVADPALANPTLVVITDRNDLDDQLFGDFSLSQDLLRQEPVQARDRGAPPRAARVAAGGVVFTTIQKFLPDVAGDRHPLLSEPANIVVIADEAHRSQYGFVDGFAAHLRDALPNASFVGFTGTPVELDDRDTRDVFGDYIDVYDIQRAVEDGATVPIYYESRLASSTSTHRSSRASTRSSRRSPRARRTERQGEAQVQVGAARGTGRDREAARAGRPRPRRALRGPPRRHGGQGDGRLHEPPDLRRPLRRRSSRSGPSGTVRRTTRRARSRSS